MTPLDPAVRWWNRDRLLVIALGIHALTYALDLSRAAASPPLGLPTLVVDLTLVLAYATMAPRVGALHVVGETRAAFLRDVWYRHWAGEDGLARLASSLDASRREDAARDSMHRALSLLEGVRLQDPAGTGALAAALAASAPGLWLARPEAASVDVPFWSAFVPVVVVFLLDPFLDLRAARELLERGAVARIASLTPRRLRDLGIGWPSILLTGLCPVAVLADALYRHPGRLPHALGLVVYLWGVLALAYWILHRLPFLQFPGPPGISVFLDVQRRAERIWFLFNSIIAVALVWSGLTVPREAALLVQLAMAAIVGTLLVNKLSTRYVGPMNDEHVLRTADRLAARWVPPDAGGPREDEG